MSLTKRLFFSLRGVTELLKAFHRSSAMQRTFTAIFYNQGWGEHASVSGSGSTLAQTIAIRREIPLLLQRWSIKSILDIPCGDLHWMKEVDLGQVRYVGADIVESLVRTNTARFGQVRDFMVLDLTKSVLPKVDLIFSRDCLVHLPLKDILAALKNVRRSGCGFFLSTTFPQTESNLEIELGQWRPINLQIAPFNLPAPLEIVYENRPESSEHWHEKSLGLWRVSDIH
jgi:hypothetical protein